jgi:hypothetical protein
MARRPRILGCRAKAAAAGVAALAVATGGCASPTPSPTQKPATLGRTCHNQEVPSPSDLCALAAMLALVALMVATFFWHARRIRDGRADPIVSPDWGPYQRPASPPSGIRWGSGAQPDFEDDHVGRPFPPSGQGNID